MNLADSGILSAAMEKSGYKSVAEPEEAGVIILNTCSVRENAEERALGRLAELAHLKKKSETYICVVGCMAQRMGESLLQRVPAIDFVLGTERLFELPALLDAKNGEPVVDTTMGKDLAWAELPPVPDNPYMGQIIITRGCNNFCAYCIVPYLRGRERHRSPEAIIADVNHLVSLGVLEIMLVGQNVNSYRWRDGVRFPELLSLVARETDIRRIRFITSHPKDLSDDLIARFGDEPKLMANLHLPLQSGSDRILKHMLRSYTYAQFRNRVELLRQVCPDIALTTDLIVGYPTETEEEFEMTLAAARDIRFDSAFMFHYSEREGTLAARSQVDDIPEEVKLRRLQTLINLQKGISYSANQREVGKVHQVLIDGTSRRDDRIWKGKTEGNKTVLIRDDRDLLGRIVPVRVTLADSWTLHGEAL